MAAPIFFFPGCRNFLCAFKQKALIAIGRGRFAEIKGRRRLTESGRQI